MSFPTLSSVTEISKIVKSASHVQDLFRAYNIHIEDEQDEDFLDNISIPIVEMACDDSCDPLETHEFDVRSSESSIIKYEDENEDDSEQTEYIDNKGPSSKTSVSSEHEGSGPESNDASGFHRCDLCGAGFRIKHSITKHKRVVHGMHQFSCMFCKASYPLKRNLIEHILTHKGPHGFKCDICCKVRPNYISIQRHIKTHAEKNIPCTKCGAWFKTKWELRSHEIQHQKDRKFTCSSCGASFINPSKLREHKLQHGDRRRYKCDVCGKIFNAQGNLTNHRKLHFDEKPFKCQYCSLTFFTISARKKHVPVHERERRKPFECQDCKKKYTSTTSLAVHKMKFHSGGRVYHCHYCKQKFRSKSAIAEHVAEHAAERPHSCQQCLCRYKNRRELRRHQREKEHYGDRNVATNSKTSDDAVRDHPSSDEEEDEDEWEMPEPEVCLSETQSAEKPNISTWSKAHLAPWLTGFHCTPEGDPVYFQNPWISSVNKLFASHPK